MSEEQLKAFLVKVKADAGLQEKLKAAADADAVVAIAMAAGFSISPDDLNKNAQSKLSDEELEVAGGGCTADQSNVCWVTVWIFAITAEEIQSIQSATMELSDDDLEGLAGVEGLWCH